MKIQESTVRCEVHEEVHMAAVLPESWKSLGVK